MKHIKKYKIFESLVDLKEELKYYFTDLEDIGCVIKIATANKVTKSGLVSFIKVYIENSDFNRSQLESLIISDLFNEVIDVTKDRLIDKNLFIDDDSIIVSGVDSHTYDASIGEVIDRERIRNKSYIELNIYKNEDKNKINLPGRRYPNDQR
jgi:hypothetical protein